MATARTNGRQAICTRYYGPTNHRGSRIKAWCAAKTVWVSWDYALGTAENHALAAQRLLDLLRWDGSYVGSGLPDASGYTFVEVP